jgi:hypothetical protein
MLAACNSSVAFLLGIWVRVRLQLPEYLLTLVRLRVSRLGVDVMTLSLQGHDLPGIAECCELVIKAHKYAMQQQPWLKMIGWDAIVSRTGP